MTLRLWQNLLSSMWTRTLTPPTFCFFFFWCFPRLFTQILLSFFDIMKSVAELFAMPSWSMSTCRRCKPWANLSRINTNNEIRTVHFPKKETFLWSRYKSRSIIYTEYIVFGPLVFKLASITSHPVIQPSCTGLTKTDAHCNTVTNELRTKMQHTGKPGIVSNQLYWRQ